MPATLKSFPARLCLLLTVVVLPGLQGCSPAGEDTVSGSLEGATTSSESGLAPVQTFNVETSKYSDLEGNGLEVASFEGRRVFVNYWATWCAPCIRELPSLARAEAELSDENYVFLLASDESVEKITDFIADRGFSGNFIKLSGYFGAHGIHAVPSSVLYDEQGEQIGSWDGAFEWDSEEMLAAIRHAGVSE